MICLLLPSILALPLQKKIPGLPSQARYDVQGEFTAIGQTAFRFPSHYSGANSFRAQTAATETATVYLGVRVVPNVEVYVDPEIAWGNAPGGGVGLGASPNGDLIGQPQLTAAPDLARAFVRWRIPMRQAKDEPVGTENIGRAPNLIAGPVPQHRLIVTAGRLAASDIFDFNSYANNPRTQFENFAFVNGLAYDFPQDPRGFTYGAAISLVNPNYAVRFGSFAVPDEPGGNVLQYDIGHGHSEQLEVQIQPQILRSKPASILRFLGFRNVGTMGTYADALQVSPPNLSAIRQSGQARSGLEINFEQGLADGGNTGVFSRLGFADGSIETEAYAEADQAFSVGGQVSGVHWKRKDDVVGLAFGAEGISGSHQRYLQQGGQGFSLGDSTLRYGTEQIAEAYYLCQATKRFQLTLDGQLISNPGYNRDRGPAPVFGIRARYTF